MLRQVRESNSRDFASNWYRIASENEIRTRREDISRNKDMVEFCVALIIYVSSATASSTRLRMHAVMHNDCIHPDTNTLCGKRLGLPFVCYEVYCVYSYISVNTDERYSFLDVTSTSKCINMDFFSLSLSLPRIHFLNVGRLQENVSLCLFVIIIIDCIIIDRWDTEEKDLWKIFLLK